MPVPIYRTHGASTHSIRTAYSRLYDCRPNVCLQTGISRHLISNYSFLQFWIGLALNVINETKPVVLLEFNIELSATD